MDEDDDHYGSIVLGISDALIEMTGVLAGLTFALKDLKLVALSGLVTGIAASLSMGASEFLSKRAEYRDSLPIKAAFYTLASYLFVVILLISPYLLIEEERFGLEPYILALSLTLCMGVIVVAGFNKWISVKQNQPFFSRFLEMLGILAIVTAVSYAIGMGLASVIDI